MEKARTASATAGSPVVYAGRFADRVAGLPAGCPVLGDWEVLPASLAAGMEGASALVVLDPFSFPFEAMTPEQRDVPLIVVLPSGSDAGLLEAVFGAPVFERLTFFDRVAAPEGSPVWEELRRRYRWTEGQLVELESGRPEEAAEEICVLLEAEAAAHTVLGDGSRKAVHRAQERVLLPQFAAARAARAGDVPFDVLEVGSGIGRWAASFDLAATRFFGVDTSDEMVAAARASFPEAAFERLGADLRLPYDDERFDLAFCVRVLHHYPTPDKRVLLSEMWRVVRPGGRLIFLEDFVAARGSGGHTVSVLGFVELLLEATAGQATLEHVESLRYPGEDVTRGGAIAVSRLGVPKRW